MRILLLGFYFPPDLGAGAFRLSALVEALVEAGGEQLHLDVVVPMPNRYKSLHQSAPEVETRDRLTIRRIALPPHRSGMRDQSRAFLAYAKGTRAATRGGSWDLVVASSSRLMTAALGADIARRSGARLYLDIRDLFTDTMTDLLGGVAGRLMLPIFRQIEKRTFRRATRINLVSGGFLDHVRKIVPDRECRVFTNGIDEEFLAPDIAATAPRPGHPPLVLYAGNIGEGQGLDHILPDAAALIGNAVRIRVIGDGGTRGRLEAALAARAPGAVELCDPVPRAELMRHYREADILFLHLNNFPAFRKVLPSKIFEYAALGKPILAGVGGFAADFIRREIPGAEVFSPCDAEAMRDALARLMLVPRPIDRSAFISNHRRKSIMARMAQDILELAATR